MPGSGGRLGGWREALTGQQPQSGERPQSGDRPQSGERPRVVTVLGMHRSGTSSLVGSLEAAGLPLGEVRSVGGASNEKGHREPAELIALHEDVLIVNGGAWHLPPTEVRWTAKLRRRRDAFIDEHAGMPLWGWKEPRTLLVIDGWLEALPQLEMVGTVRHPATVARSLQRRHGSDSVDMWLELWLAYNARLLALAEARGVAIIDFDLPDEQYRAGLLAMVSALGLTAPAAGDGFFDDSLRTAQKDPPTMALPREVERVYARLREIAAN